MAYTLDTFGVFRLCARVWKGRQTWFRKAP